MHARLREDERLTRFTKICLRFSRAERETMRSHAVFKVKKKTFAYFLNDHHWRWDCRRVVQGASGR